MGNVGKYGLVSEEISHYRRLLEDVEQNKKNALVLFKQQYKQFLDLDVKQADRKQLFKKLLVELKAKKLAEQLTVNYAAMKTDGDVDVRFDQAAINKVVAQIKPLSNEEIANQISKVIADREKIEQELEKLVASGSVSLS